MLTRKTVILAKIESSYGVDATPTVSANALLVRNVVPKPMGDPIKRDYLRADFSPLEFRRGPRHMELSFEVEIKGTGTAGTLPSWGWEGELLRACGLDETIESGVNIKYAPVSADFESASVYVYKDGIFHKMLGCRGDVALVWPEVGHCGYYRFSLQGLYTGPADSSPSSPTYSSVVPPQLLSAGITIASYSPVGTRIEVAMNNTLGKRGDWNDVEGIKEIMITGRDPGGSFDPESVLEATHPFWADWAAANAKALNIGPLGSVAGNKVTITAPKMQLEDISYGDREGIQTYEIPFRLARSTGDDELEIKFE